MITNIEPQNSDSAEASVVESDGCEPVAASAGQADPTNAAEFQQQNDIVKKGVATFIEVGIALRKINEGELWKAGGHKTWESYCLSVGGLSLSYARRLIESSTLALELRVSLPIGRNEGVHLPASESQVRPLLRLKASGKRVEAWTSACDKAAGQPTAAQVTEAVLVLLPGKKKESVSKPAKVKAPVSPVQAVVLPTAKAAELVTQLREVVDQGESWDAVERILAEMEYLLGSSSVAA